MEEETILKKFHLKNNPFSPVKGPDGDDIDSNVLIKTLCPHDDPRVKYYFFDMYDWDKCDCISKLSKQSAFLEFPEIDFGAEHELCYMIILSGDAYCGKKSLKNLILYKLKDTAEVPPLIIQYFSKSLSESEAVKALARLFRDKYSLGKSKDIQEKLKEIYKEEVNEEIKRESEYYSTLFQRYSNLVRSNDNDRKLPIIFIIEGKGNNDFWETIFDVIEPLCDIIIITTLNRDHALACYNSMKLSGNKISNVHTQNLDLKKTKLYLLDRLQSERMDEKILNNKLIPFSQKYIDRLFEINSKEIKSSDITWSTIVKKY